MPYRAPLSEAAEESSHGMNGRMEMGIRGVDWLAGIRPVCFWDVRGHQPLRGGGR